MKGEGKKPGKGRLRVPCRDISPRQETKKAVERNDASVQAKGIQCISEEGQI